MEAEKHTHSIRLEEDNLCNSIFSGLLGVELQPHPHVPHAIELIQGIRSIASHDWRHLNQIPSTADLSSLPGMFHLLQCRRRWWRKRQRIRRRDEDYDDEEEKEDDMDPYDTNKTVDNPTK